LLIDPAGDTVNVRGNQLPYAPRHMAGASLVVSRPAFSLRVDGLLVSEQFADNFETDAPSPNGRNGVIPSYTIWTGAAGVTVPGTRARVEATVKNFLGATYGASRRPEGIKPSLPRTLQVGLQWAF
jgi:Fe(3+) dicitrate transport protein